MLTATITKKSVKRAGMEKLFYITVNLSVKEGETEVINKDFTFEYRPGDNVTLKYQELLKDIQAEITNYKSEQTLFASTKLDTLITSLNSNITI